MSVAVAVENLSVELGGLPVLRGVSFAVHPGEAVALLGGNGSGKSTLVRTLMGLIPVERGGVELFGTPLAGFRQWARVGYVPQRSPAPLAGAKVGEVVASGRLARRRPFLPARPADRAAVRQALALVGLEGRGGDDMAHLSGGQHQRVLIARALASEPDLLVLDEPNAGVDLPHQQVLAAILQGLVARGTAVLVVLHEVGPLSPLIDRAVVLSAGRLVYDGPLAELRTRQPGGPGHHDHDHGSPADRLAGWLDGAVER